MCLSSHFLSLALSSLPQQFCYTNFAVLVSTKANRTRFCEEILLKPAIFQKLFLSWSFTIRAYFLHLLVFRLARVNDFPHPKDDPNGKTAVSVARVFGQRLDEIRKRHDELSPSPASTDDGSEEDPDDFARFKRRPQSFVSTIKHTPSVHRTESASVTKAERVLGIGMPDPVLSPKGEQKVQSRAAKWLRALGGKGSKGKPNGGTTGVTSGSFSSLDSPLITNEPRRRKMTALDELDLDDLDSDSDGSDEGNSSLQSSNRLDSSEPRSDASDSSEPPRALQDGAERAVDPAETNHGDNIAMDASFDLQSPTSPFPPTAPGTTAGRSSAASPRVSRAFSKRSSILPGPAFDLVGDDETPVPTIPAHLRNGYDKALHIYAVQSLREYEQTVQVSKTYQKPTFLQTHFSFSSFHLSRNTMSSSNLKPIQMFQQFQDWAFTGLK